MSAMQPEGMSDPQHIPQLALGTPSQIAPQPPQPTNPLDGLVPPQPEPPQIPVNSYDNHAVHIIYHNRFRKSEKFEQLSDTAKQMFEKHVQAHQMALQAGMTPADSSGFYEDGGDQQSQQLAAAQQQQSQGSGSAFPAASQAQLGTYSPVD